jgi:uncharacterized protein (DUF2252 family)
MEPLAATAAPSADLSTAQRAAIGKQARAQVPRSSHAEWEPSGNRPDPIEVLEGQAATRVPELVPIRYGRMLTSAFAFFRGSAAVMAADLAETPHSGLRAQLCGDAHLANLGAFAAPDRQLVFDLNDFDETLPGPWEWDVKRLVASFAIAGRERGLSRKQRRTAARTAVREYREAMRGFAEMRNLDVWYSRLDAGELVDRLRRVGNPKRMREFERNVAKARAKDHLRALGRLTHRVNGSLRIVSDPPLIVPIEELSEGQHPDAVETQVRSLLRTYRESLPGDRRQLLDTYRFAHLARKVVGVGSVGTRAWIVLMIGRDDEDPLFLQFKEADASVLEPYAGESRYENHGERVVKGQRLMQATGDIFLGWLPAVGMDGRPRDFYGRQLWDWKRSAHLEEMDAEGYELYAQACGWTLARAHARSGDRVAIAAYLGSGDVFDRAIAEFAERYADQAERDHGALGKAIKSGRITATEGL